MSDSIIASPANSRPWKRLLVVVIGVAIALDAFTDLARTWPFLVAAAVLGVVLVAARRPARVSELLNGLSLAVVTCLILAAGAEIAFRELLVVPRVPESQDDFNRVYTWHWPRRIAETKPEGTFRIIGISDSFGAMGGENNYHYALERTLTDDGLPIELVNLSSGTYSPIDELEVMRRIAPRFDPDVIVYGFYVGNDFWHPTGTPILVNGMPMRLESGIRGWRPANLVSTGWLRRYIAAWRDQSRRDRETDADGRSGFWSVASFDRVAEARYELLDTGAADGQRWNETADVLHDMGAWAADLGVPLLIVIHPDAFQVQDILRGRLEQRFVERNGSPDFEAPQRFLRDALDRTTADGNPAVLDMLPIFRERGAGGDLYGFRDTHYDSTGHHLAARQIADALEERGWLPEPGRAGGE